MGACGPSPTAPLTSPHTSVLAKKSPNIKIRGLQEQGGETGQGSDVTTPVQHQLGDAFISEG